MFDFHKSLSINTLRQTIENRALLRIKDLRAKSDRLLKFFPFCVDKSRDGNKEVSECFAEMPRMANMTTTQLTADTVLPVVSQPTAGRHNGVQTKDGGDSGAMQTPPILPTGSLFDAVGVVLDLSLEGRDLLGAYSQLNSDDRSVFLDIVASLLSQGVVGRETLEVNGEAYSCFVTTRLGDPRLMHACPYRGSEAGASFLDLQA